MNIEEAKRILQNQFNHTKKHDFEIFPSFAIDSGVASALKVLLNAPIMPEHPSDELLVAMMRGWHTNAAMQSRSDLAQWELDGYRREYNALRAACSTPPKPKMKTVKMKTVWYFSCELNGKYKLYEHDSEESANINREHPLNSIKQGHTTWKHVSPVWSEEVEVK